MYYTRFCFYAEDYDGYGNGEILYPWSTADGAYWEGSGDKGKISWQTKTEMLTISCPTEGGRNTSAELSMPSNMWHQITAKWDASTPGAPVCSLWLDKDSSGAPDATAAGADMVTDPFDIDGIALQWRMNSNGVHFDFLQVDDTETDLVDVFGNDCRE
jgi:hypothetical protein